MRKRMLSLSLALMMLLTLLPTGAQATTVIEVVPCKYDGVENFSEGLAAVTLNGKYGFVDKTGAEVAPCKYDEVEEFSEGLAMVILNERWGFIDKTGAEVIPP